MMNRRVWVLAGLALGLASFAGAYPGEERYLAAKAMEEYQKGNFAAAAELYQKASEKAPNEVALRFNEANALYKDKKVEQALEKFKSVYDERNAELNAAAEYNAGVVKHREAADEIEKLKSGAAAQQAPVPATPAPQGAGGKEKNPLDTAISTLEKAVTDYRKSLKISASNNDARHNYEYAKEQLEILKRIREQQQQQQQQQSKDQQQQDKQDQQQQNQDQNKQNENKDQQNQDQKNQQGQQGQDKKQDEQKNNDQNKQDNQQDKKDEGKQDQNKDEQNQSQQKEKDEPGKEGEKQEQKDQKDDKQDKPGDQKDGKDKQDKDEKQKQDQQKGQGQKPKPEKSDKDSEEGEPQEAQAGEMSEQDVQRLLNSLPGEDRKALQRFYNGNFQARGDMDKDW
ncbi:MAG: hypothetical protein K1X53_13925 [Candidatus Sumerlaeaceae bacterium]|nr:hypothetical protein [Candidatus Sumerlaeaceae bacterium]